MRKAFADKVVETAKTTEIPFTAHITPSVAESIIVAQDISQNIKHSNADLAALTEVLNDLKPFPTSMLV